MMNQIEHGIISLILGYITWYGFWGPLFLKQTTPEEWERANKQADWFLDKLL